MGTTYCLHPRFTKTPVPLNNLTKRTASIPPVTATMSRTRSRQAQLDSMPLEMLALARQNRELVGAVESYAASSALPALMRAYSGGDKASAKATTVAPITEPTCAIAFRLLHRALHTDTSVTTVLNSSIVHTSPQASCHHLLSSYRCPRSWRSPTTCCSWQTSSWR
jgi:hypothetical protein